MAESWKLVGDVWSLIFRELGCRELGRLDQVHPYFRPLLGKNPAYQHGRISSLKEFHHRLRMACQWNYWSAAELCWNSTEFRVRDEVFLDYYPQSQAHLWDLYSPYEHTCIIREAWQRGQYEIANALADQITFYHEYFGTYEKFISATQENYDQILPLVPTLHPGLFETFFLVFVRLGSLSQVQAIYHLRPQLSASVLQLALQDSQFSHLTEWLQGLRAN